MWTVLAIIIGIAALIALADYVRYSFKWQRAEHLRREAVAAAEAKRVETATIVEDVSYTSIGQVSIVMLVITTVAMLFLFFVHNSLTSAVQETVLGVVWIALNVLFGIGILAGKRRTQRFMVSEDAIKIAPAILHPSHQ